MNEWINHSTNLVPFSVDHHVSQIVNQKRSLTAVNSTSPSELYSTDLMKILMAESPTPKPRMILLRPSSSTTRSSLQTECDPWWPCFHSLFLKLFVNTKVKSFINRNVRIIIHVGLPHPRIKFIKFICILSSNCACSYCSTCKYVEYRSSVQIVCSPFSIL